MKLFNCLWVIPSCPYLCYPLKTRLQNAQLNYRVRCHKYWIFWTLFSPWKLLQNEQFWCLLSVVKLLQNSVFALGIPLSLTNKSSPCTFCCLVLDYCSKKAMWHKLQIELHALVLPDSVWSFSGNTSTCSELRGEKRSTCRHWKWVDLKALGVFLYCE